nr:RNA polymerase beta'' subunit [Chlorogonium euchlorum]
MNWKKSIYFNTSISFVPFALPYSKAKKCRDFPFLSKSLLLTQAFGLGNRQKTPKGFFGNPKAFGKEQPKALLTKTQRGLLVNQRFFWSFQKALPFGSQAFGLGSRSFRNPFGVVPKPQRGFGKNNPLGFWSKPRLLEQGKERKGGKEWNSPCFSLLPNRAFYLNLNFKTASLIYPVFACSIVKKQRQGGLISFNFGMNNYNGKREASPKSSGPRQFRCSAGPKLSSLIAKCGKSLTIFQPSVDSAGIKALIPLRIQSSLGYGVTSCPIGQHSYKAGLNQGQPKPSAWVAPSNPSSYPPFISGKSKGYKFFFNQCFDKGRLKNFVLWFLLNYGEHKTVTLVEQLKNVGFEYASKAGISLGIDDLKIPPKKAELIYDAEKQTTQTVNQYVRGEITGVERFQRLIDTWHRTSEVLKQEVIDYFEATDILNPVYMMAFSGARGNISQVRQLVGMRGLMADPQGQIIDFPIRSNFREGLTLTEYIISSYGARKGIVDTALRTANAGYLTRRLVDVAQHVIISLKDCGTRRGIFLINMKEGNKTIHSLSQRTVGRILARDLFSPTSSIIGNNEKKRDLTSHKFQKNHAYPASRVGMSGELLARRNDEVTLDLAFEIGKKFEKVFVRSPLTCETNNLICQLCYGWSLAQGNLVSIGEAVGVIAAQSIGEPGTQLTMRTFHTGGVFSGDISEYIFAPFNGFVEYISAIPGTLIRTPEGKIAFLTKSEGSFIVVGQDPSYSSPTEEGGNKGSHFILSTEGNGQRFKGLHAESLSISKRYKVPHFTLLYIRNGQAVTEKEVIAQISTISRKGNATDDAELTIKSDYEGQFYSKSLGFREKDIGPEIKNLSEDYKQDILMRYPDNKTGSEKIYEAWTWGYAWILSGKIYEANSPSRFFAQLGDYLNLQSCMSQTKWKIHLNQGNTNLIKFNIPRLPGGQDWRKERTLNVFSTGSQIPFTQSYIKSASSFLPAEGLGYATKKTKKFKERKALGYQKNYRPKNSSFLEGVNKQHSILNFDLKKILFKQYGYILFLTEKVQFLKMPLTNISLAKQSSRKRLNADKGLAMLPVPPNFYSPYSPVGMTGGTANHMQDRNLNLCNSHKFQLNKIEQEASFWDSSRFKYMKKRYNSPKINLTGDLLFFMKNFKPATAPLTGSVPSFITGLGKGENPKGMPSSETKQNRDRQKTPKGFFGKPRLGLFLSPFILQWFPQTHQTLTGGYIVLENTVRLSSSSPESGFFNLNFNFKPSSAKLGVIDPKSKGAPSAERKGNQRAYQKNKYNGFFGFPKVQRAYQKTPLGFFGGTTTKGLLNNLLILERIGMEKRKAKINNLNSRTHVWNNQPYSDGLGRQFNLSGQSKETKYISYSNSHSLSKLKFLKKAPLLLSAHSKDLAWSERKAPSLKFVQSSFFKLVYKQTYNLGVPLHTGSLMKKASNYRSLIGISGNEATPSTAQFAVDKGGYKENNQMKSFPRNLYKGRGEQLSKSAYIIMHIDKQIPLFMQTNRQGSYNYLNLNNKSSYIYMNNNGYSKTPLISQSPSSILRTFANANKRSEVIAGEKNSKILLKLKVPVSSLDLLKSGLENKQSFGKPNEAKPPICTLSSTFDGAIKKGGLRKKRKIKNHKKRDLFLCQFNFLNSFCKTFAFLNQTHDLFSSNFLKNEYEKYFLIKNKKKLNTFILKELKKASYFSNQESYSPQSANLVNGKEVKRIGGKGVSTVLTSLRNIKAWNSASSRIQNLTLLKNILSLNMQFPSLSCPSPSSIKLHGKSFFKFKDSKATLSLNLRKFHLLKKFFFNPVYLSKISFSAYFPEETAFPVPSEPVAFIKNHNEGQDFKSNNKYSSVYANEAVPASMRKRNGIFNKILGNMKYGWVVVVLSPNPNLPSAGKKAGEINGKKKKKHLNNYLSLHQTLIQPGDRDKEILGLSLPWPAFAEYIFVPEIFDFDKIILFKDLNKISALSCPLIEHRGPYYYNESKKAVVGKSYLCQDSSSLSSKPTGKPSLAKSKTYNFQQNYYNGKQTNLTRVEGILPVLSVDEGKFKIKNKKCRYQFTTHNMYCTSDTNLSGASGGGHSLGIYLQPVMEYNQSSQTCLKQQTSETTSSIFHNEVQNIFFNRSLLEERPPVGQEKSFDNSPSSIASHLGFNFNNTAGRAAQARSFLNSIGIANFKFNGKLGRDPVYIYKRSVKPGNSVYTGLIQKYNQKYVVNQSFDSLYHWKNNITPFFNKQQKTHHPFSKYPTHDFSIITNPSLNTLINKYKTSYFNHFLANYIEKPISVPGKQEGDKRNEPYILDGTGNSTGLMENGVEKEAFSTIRFVSRKPLNFSSFVIIPTFGETHLTGSEATGQCRVAGGQISFKHQVYSLSYQPLSIFDSFLYPSLASSISVMLSFYLTKISETAQTFDLMGLPRKNPLGCTETPQRVFGRTGFAFFKTKQQNFGAGSDKLRFGKPWNGFGVKNHLNSLFLNLFESPCFSFNIHERLNMSVLSSTTAKQPSSSSIQRLTLSFPYPRLHVLSAPCQTSLAPKALGLFIDQKTPKGFFGGTTQRVFGVTPKGFFGGKERGRKEGSEGLRNRKKYQTVPVSLSFTRKKSVSGGLGQGQLTKFLYNYRKELLSYQTFAKTNHYSPFNGEIVYTRYNLDFNSPEEMPYSKPSFSFLNISYPADDSCMFLTKADLISYYLPSKNFIHFNIHEAKKNTYTIQDTLIKFVNMTSSNDITTTLPSGQSGLNLLPPSILPDVQPTGGQDKATQLVPQGLPFPFPAEGRLEGSLEGSLEGRLGLKISNLKAGAPLAYNFSLLGDFFVYGDPISPLTAIQTSGQVIHYNHQKITLRRAQPIFISPKGILRKFDGDFIDPKAPVITLSYQRLKTGDIIQGIPKVEQFFEARTTKRGRLFRDSLPSLLKGLFERYLAKIPLDLAVRQSFYKIQQIVVDGVQRVYKSQGVTISDKHLEVIVKQMTNKVRILDGAQTGFFPGEVVDLCFVEKINSFLIKKITYEPLVLGITKASLEVDSFLSAASFQQTTRVLSKAAIYRKKDFLKGLKENVILGNLIPAGTGYLVYLDDLN